MRITDLFRKIDKSGDGLVSRDELREGLLLLSQPCPTAVFAQKKALEKELRAHREEVQRKAELRHFLTRMHAAAESGAAEVIDKIEVRVCEERRSHELTRHSAAISNVTSIFTFATRFVLRRFSSGRTKCECKTCSGRWTGLETGL